MSEAAFLKFIIDNWDTIAGSALGVPLLVVGSYERFWAGRKHKKLQEKVEKLQKEVDSKSEEIKSYRRDCKQNKAQIKALQNRFAELDNLKKIQDEEIKQIKKAWEQSAIRDNKRFSDMQALRETIANKQTHIDYIKEKIQALEIQMNKSVSTQQETLVLVAEIKGSFS